MKKDFLYNKNIRIIGGIIAFILFIILILFVIKPFQEIEGYIIAGLIITSFLQLIFFSCFMIVLIETCINSNDKKRIFISFGTNLTFSASSFIFVFNTIYLKEPLFQVSGFVTLFFIIFFINKYIKIETGNDLSILKATNYFLISIYAVIMFFLEKYNVYDSIGQFINFYLFIPLLMIQGLYELLDRRSKKCLMGNCV